jgi:hypothetical protein
MAEAATSAPNRMLPSSVYRRRRAVAVLVLAVLAGAGVGALVGGSGGGKGAVQISGSPRDALATVNAFQVALERHDWATICNRLYSDQARKRAGGPLCPATLATTAGGIRQPRSEVKSIAVSGKYATVTVSASINGGAPVTSVIHLVREHSSYRILYAGAGGVGD